MNADWRKSTFSSEYDCVEAASGDRVLVRDTADRGGPVLAVTAGAWRTFTDALKGGTA